MYVRPFPEFCGACIIAGWGVCPKINKENLRLAYEVFYNDTSIHCAYRSPTSAYIVLNEAQESYLRHQVKEMGFELVYKKCNINTGNMCYTYVADILTLRERGYI